jgi:hypothetical protein
MSSNKKSGLDYSEHKARERLHKLESLIPFRGFIFLTSSIKYKVDSPIEDNRSFKSRALLLQALYFTAALLALAKLLELVKVIL